MKNYLMNILLPLNLLLIQKSTAKSTEVEQNNVESLVFAKTSSGYEATINTKRPVGSDVQINLMQSSTPNEPNSFILVKELNDRSKVMNRSKRIVVELENYDVSDKKKCYSFQLKDNDIICSSEAFKYSEKDDNLMILRAITGGDKESLFEQYKWVLWVVLGVIGGLIGIFILWKLFKKRTV